MLHPKIKKPESSKWVKAQLRLAAHYLKLANSVDLDRMVWTAWPIRIW